MKSFLLALSRHPLSLAGSALTTASALLILTLFGVGLIGFTGGPYVGIITFVILPSVFLVGLALIPLGIALDKRRARRAAGRGEPVPSAAFPVIDLNIDRTRKIFLWFVALTCVNVMILSLATYKGVEVMDSTEFCGTTCHSVMTPEFTTYQRSPHSHVNCVSCHIGPGADWFVKSKLSGSWQLAAVTFNLYPRPIAAPVKNLRPARETCEQCHWPTKFVGDTLKIITHYADDEASTERKTVLLMRVGGLQGRTSHGIHWHVDPSIRIRYRSDPAREKIGEVELTRADGTVEMFRAQEGTPGGPASRTPGGTATGPDNGDAHAEWRVMDCVDCHNRPSHVYRMPQDELDRAIQIEAIDRSLPFVRREGLKALQGSYGSHEEAKEEIRTKLRSFYATSYPEAAAAKSQQIESAADAMGEIYATNVFPSMKIGWGTYPNHIGHQNSPGCFRCHDDEHKTAAGKTIFQDCATCHTPLAMDEENPEILKQLQP